VIYSFCRAPRVENSPSVVRDLFARRRRHDGARSLTLVVKTAGPYPVLRARFRPSSSCRRRRNGAGEVTFDRQECKGTAHSETEAFNAGTARSAPGLTSSCAYQGRPHRARAQRRLTGARSRAGSAWSSGHHQRGPARRGAARGRRRRDRERPDPGSRAVRPESELKVVQGLSARVILPDFNYIDDAPPGVADSGGKNPVP